MHKKPLLQEIDIRYTDLMAAYTCCLIEIHKIYKIGGFSRYASFKGIFAISLAQSRIIKTLDALKDDFALLAAADVNSNDNSNNIFGYRKYLNEVIVELSMPALIRFGSSAAIFTGIIAAIPIILKIIDNIGIIAYLFRNAGNFDLSLRESFIWLEPADIFILLLYILIYAAFFAVFFGRKRARVVFNENDLLNKERALLDALYKYSAALQAQKVPTNDDGTDGQFEHLHQPN